MVDDGNGLRSLDEYNCPGFCGRTALSCSHGNITYSDCRACGWGSRSVQKFLCTPCQEPLILYDWLFLLFIAIIPLLLHASFIQFYAPRKSVRKQQVAQFFCCVVECTLSAFMSVMVMPPFGKPTLYGCPKLHLREWYPMLYNPVVNHTHILRCSYEIVFPLYSIPFIYFAFNLLSLLICRSILYTTTLRGTAVSFSPYYAALYSLPTIALLHSVLAGLLYYSFPYVVLICSLALNAVHMALKRNKPMRLMCVEMLTKADNISVLLIHMALFGFSLFTLISNLSMFKSTLYLQHVLVVILFIPLPSLFYLLTIGITNPAYVHSSS